MSLTLEKRVEALETRFAELADAIQARPARIAWRSVVGMFADDPQIDELHRETQRIRGCEKMGLAPSGNGENPRKISGREGACPNFFHSLIREEDRAAVWDGNADES